MFSKDFKRDMSKKRDSGRKENNLDYYISKNSVELKNDDGSQNDETLKHEFLKKNLKASSVIPRKTTKYYETPDRLGYFETRFGTLAVGNKKYDKKSPVVFSLVPESAKATQGISDTEINSPNYYFGNSSKITKRKFRASEISFKYDPERSEIQKLKDDKDGLVDDEKELLYPDDKEEYLIENLEKQKNKKNVDQERISKNIEKMRDIKKEKQEDNEEFLKELNDFVHKLKKDKLKTRKDSDEVSSRMRRIMELSMESELNALDLIQLRKRLEEILEKEELLKVIPAKYKSLDFGSLGKQEIIEMINQLRKLSPDK